VLSISNFRIEDLTNKAAVIVQNALHLQGINIIITKYAIPWNIFFLFHVFNWICRWYFQSVRCDVVYIKEFVAVHVKWKYISVRYTESFPFSIFVVEIRSRKHSGKWLSNCRYVRHTWAETAHVSRTQALEQRNETCDNELICLMFLLHKIYSYSAVELL